MFPWLICVIIDVAMHHVDWSMNSGHVSWYCLNTVHAFSEHFKIGFVQYFLSIPCSCISLTLRSGLSRAGRVFPRLSIVATCHVAIKIMILMMLVMITSPVLWTKATSPRLFPKSSTPAAFSSSSFFFLSFSSCSSTCLRNSFWISGTSASGK